MSWQNKLKEHLYLITSSYYCLYLQAEEAVVAYFLKFIMCEVHNGEKLLLSYGWNSNKSHILCTSETQNTLAAQNSEKIMVAHTCSLGLCMFVLEGFLLA